MRIAIALVLGAALTGCGDDPTSTLTDAGLDLAVSADASTDSSTTGLDGGSDLGAVDSGGLIDGGTGGVHVTGTINGNAVSTVAAQHLSAPIAVGEQRFDFLVGDHPALCGGSQIPDSFFINFQITLNSPTPLLLPPGTYSFSGTEVTAAPASVTVASVSASFQDHDAECVGTSEAATAGTIVISEWSGTDASGTVTLTFEDGSVSGPFEAPTCPGGSRPTCP